MAMVSSLPSIPSGVFQFGTALLTRTVRHSHGESYSLFNLSIPVVNRAVRMVRSDGSTSTMELGSCCELENVVFNTNPKHEDWDNEEEVDDICDFTMLVGHEFTYKAGRHNASVFIGGSHNPLDLYRIRFLERSGILLSSDIDMVIDFSYEGVAAPLAFDKHPLQVAYNGINFVTERGTSPAGAVAFIRSLIDTRGHCDPEDQFATAPSGEYWHMAPQPDAWRA
jgi:hypothetical protein